MSRNAASAFIAARVVWVCGAASAACIPDLPSDALPPAPPAPLAATGPVCGDGIIDLDAGEQCDPGPGNAGGDSGIAGCERCRIQCAGLTWKNNHCYHIEPHASALQSGNGSANDLCQKTNGHVVTFASVDELQAVADYVAVSPDTSAFWVGLDTDPANASGSMPSYGVLQGLLEPGWSPTCPGCYANVEAGSPLPVFAGASTDAGGTGCVIAGPDVQQPWQQYPCSVAISRRVLLGIPQAICEREPVGRMSVPCEAGVCIDLEWTHDSKRYVYLDKSMSGDDARKGCLAIRGQLVVLKSHEEREQLWHELSHLTVPPYGVWIGLSQVGRCSSPQWVWEDGTPESQYPSQWGDRQPTRCWASRAFLLRQSGFDDTLAHNDQANSTFPAVCEITAATRAIDAGGN